jgi:hypothetical protein
MPRKVNAAAESLKQAKALLGERIDNDAAMEKLGAKGSTPLARRLAAAEAASPKRAQAFREIAARMITWAPNRVRTLQRAVLFYIPDGAYQMQVFAIDDAQDNSLVVCCEDVLSAATASGLLASRQGEPGVYTIEGSKQTLTVERLDGKTENPPPYINSMTGWNRRAMKIILPPDMTATQVEAALLVCALTAQTWKTAPAKAPLS